VSVILHKDHERIVRLRERITRMGRECGITDYGFTTWNVELTRSKVPLFKASRQISSASRVFSRHTQFSASTIRSPSMRDRNHFVMPPDQCPLVRFRKFVSNDDNYGSFVGSPAMHVMVPRNFVISRIK